MAPIVARLAGALERDGRFAGGDRVVDVAIALERMFVLDQRNISRTLQDRVAWYLGTDEKGRSILKKSVKEVYDARSDIVHNRPDKALPHRNRAAFAKGFDIARRSLFKLLREGWPENWDESAIAGD